MRDDRIVEAAEACSFRVARLPLATEPGRTSHALEWLERTGRNICIAWSSRRAAGRLTGTVLPAHQDVLARLPLFAVGAESAAPIQDRHLDVAYVAEEPSASSLARRIVEARGSHDIRRVAFLRGDRSLPDLPAALDRAGIEVESFEIYRTTFQSPDVDVMRSSIAANDPVVVLYFSPSGIEALGAAPPRGTRGAPLRAHAVPIGDIHESARSRPTWVRLDRRPRRRPVRPSGLTIGQEDPSVSYPTTRLRRLRATPALRAMRRETTLAASNLVAPLFVCHGSKVRRPVSSMPGHFQLSVDELVREGEAIAKDGIGGVILFGIPSSKDAEGREAYDEKGIVPTALRALKKAVPDLILWADVCLCEYTSHGHCGVLNGDRVDNDKTLPLLARAATAYAAAGADLIAPSDMMDGRVGTIRRALDSGGFPDTPIVSYAAKYASAFYGPFREAAESTPQFGDRRGYQMDPANAAEALREVALDLEEGADMVMVKPALPYLDVIRRVKEQFQVPVAAYNVSGEFAMIKAAAQNGWLDGERAALETLVSIRRAGPT